jgi:hypothetical protein
VTETADETRAETIYHETVTEFRAELAQSASGFRDRTALYRGRPAAGLTGVERDAYTGCLMAGNYAYTLAAVLGEAGKFGPEVQQRLATVADDILMNGDDRDRNADVMPEAEVGNA